MVLASQFNSFIHPVTVLTRLPFSVPGALLALSLTGQSLNIYSMIGLILLMGIVKKNSILLVDFTNQLRERGLGVTSAAAGLPDPPAAHPDDLDRDDRRRHPARAGLRPGRGDARPMAVAVIGGMMLSTVLTLFVVPCAYSVLDDLVTWNEERMKRGQGLLSGIFSSSPQPKTARMAEASARD